MKHLFLLVVIGVCLTACAPANQDANIDVVKKYITSVEDLDFDSMNYFLAEDYLGMGPSYGDSIGKYQAVENWKWNVANLYESIKYNRSRFAAVSIPDGDNKGNWVANWAELNIVFKDGLGDVTILANTNYLIENGKIIRSITFYNEADALFQMGFMFVPLGFGE